MSAINSAKRLEALSWMHISGGTAGHPEPHCLIPAKQRWIGINKSLKLY